MDRFCIEKIMRVTKDPKSKIGMFLLLVLLICMFIVMILFLVLPLLGIDTPFIK
jgi:hypothetical protein